MKHSDINDILQRAAGSPHDVDPALLDRISNSIGSSLRPVRPLPPASVLVCGLLVICAAAAALVAAVLGFYGIRRLGAAEIAAIFPLLGVVTWVTALASTGEMTPGRAPRIPAFSFPLIGSVALIAVFAALFHDYHVDAFVRRGVACLTAGFIDAVIAGVASLFLLRRGFAVNPIAAGLVTGTLAGFAGVTMLELHCPNFQALHILVWHTAVVPLSALGGAIAAAAISRWPRGVAIR